MRYRAELSLTNLLNFLIIWTDDEILADDWQAAYLAFMRRYRTNEQTLETMTLASDQNMPTRNLYFIMGTMAKRHTQLIFIGLPRSGLDPEECGKQGDLF